jgi:hypothetical protein
MRNLKDTVFASLVQETGWEAVMWYWVKNALPVMWVKPVT